MGRSDAERRLDFYAAGFRFVLSPVSWKCGVCGLEVKPFEAAKWHLFSHDPQVWRNARIIERTKPFRNLISKWRRLWAVWRLYREHDFPPQLIAAYFNIQLRTVTRYIGGAYTYLCEKDKDCLLKRLDKLLEDF